MWMLNLEAMQIRSHYQKELKMHWIQELARGTIPVILPSEYLAST